MGAPEATVEKYLVARVRALGGLCLKFESPGTAGVPDRVVITPSGGTQFVECKAPCGKLRPLQALMGERIRRAGGEFHVLDSRNAVDAFMSTLTT